MSDARDTSNTITDMNDKVTPIKRAWYEIKNAAASTAEIYIYDQIGEDFWTGQGVTAKNFVEDLAKLKAQDIHLHINSPGGSVFDAHAIYTALKRSDAKVTTFIDGLAASAASYVALAGDKVVMAANALFMIHNPMGGAVGDAREMRKMADVLDKIRESIVSVYMTKSNLTEQEIIDAMDAETWYTAAEAQAAGFVDEIGVALDVAARFDAKTLTNMGFKHVPDVSNVGRVLSAQNEERIRNAHSSLADVLTALDKTVTENVAEVPVSAEVPAEQVSGSDGASESDVSDGASDIQSTEIYVPGVGFTTFETKGE